MLAKSRTEKRNPRTVDIDKVSTLRVLELLNNEDCRVAPAVRDVLPELATAVDAAVKRYSAGGTIHYFGAGTSGRIGVLDASELPPTFSVPSYSVVAHHAGGEQAIEQAVESAEDDAELGRRSASSITAGDVVIGVAASGRTPYVTGAIEHAVEAGAFTVLISSDTAGIVDDIVDVLVFVDTGPEAIAGSTRLKAGTAQKMVLNSFSTALMIKLGKTHSNLMVDVAPANDKLRDRVVSILMEASGENEATCLSALDEAGGNTKTAVVTLITGSDVKSAEVAIKEASGSTKSAIEMLQSRKKQQPTVRTRQERQS